MAKTGAVATTNRVHLSYTYMVNFNISFKMGFTSEVYIVYLFSLETNI